MPTWSRRRSSSTSAVVPVPRSDGIQPSTTLSTKTDFHSWPLAEWHRRTAALATRGTATQARHLGVGPKPAAGHKIYLYLLRSLKIDRPNQVWAMDITYIPMARGFVYLAAVVDWFTRRVLSWRLSITMEVEFCLLVLKLRMLYDCDSLAL